MSTPYLSESRCYNCKSNMFYFDSEHDRVCFSCGRTQPEFPPRNGIRPHFTLVSPPTSEIEKGIEREEVADEVLAQSVATERYRNSPLYRQTRKKHDTTYEQSERGRERRKIYREYKAALRDFARTIFTQGDIANG